MLLTSPKGDPKTPVRCKGCSKMTTIKNYAQHQKSKTCVRTIDFHVANAMEFMIQYIDPTTVYSEVADTMEFMIQRIETNALVFGL